MTQIGLGAVLVAAVVVIFLRRLVPSIIIATIVFAVLIGALGFAFSGQTINVLALSIVPAFCATFVREKFADRQNPDDQPRDPLPRGLYGRLLSAAMAAPAATTAVIVAVIGGCALLWPAIGSELFPTVDSGSFEIRIKTLPGTELLETEKLVARIEASIKEVIPAEEIETLIANIGLPVGKGAGFSSVLSLNAGPDTAYLIVNLKQRNRSTPSGEYIERLRTKLAEDYPLEQFLFVSGGIVNMALNEGVPTPISVQVSAGRCSSAVTRRNASSPPSS
jgi:multidrug efflux pump subunit AcrB